ncbi:hypothetical protein [Novipirellula caenicola]|uniref:hypothetical protein n=1 Tax=Novipirellula caenicola TaxID=1536901 RepID=UPI0031EA5D6F
MGSPNASEQKVSFRPTACDAPKPIVPNRLPTTNGRCVDGGNVADGDEVQRWPG